MAMALNKTAAKGKTEVTRAITQRYQIKASEVSNSMTMRNASAKQGGQLQASISIFGSTKQRGRSLNMIHFAERKVTLAQGRKRAKDGTQNQLRFNIIKGQGGKMIKGSFIGNKGRTIFIREGKARLPDQRARHQAHQRRVPDRSGPRHQTKTQGSIMIIGRCIYTTFLYPIRLKSIFQQQSMAEKNRIRKTRAEKKGTPATPPNTGAKRREKALAAKFSSYLTPT